MNTCRFPDCTKPVPEGLARCDKHQLRWLPGQPVERPVESPWVRRALDRKLPGKVCA